MKERCYPPKSNDEGGKNKQNQQVMVVISRVKGSEKVGKQKFINRMYKIKQLLQVYQVLVLSNEANLSG